MQNPAGKNKHVCESNLILTQNLVFLWQLPQLSPVSQIMRILAIKRQT